MNIFLTDPDPVKCAQALDDLRLNKMICETGQILCNAYRYLYMNGGMFPYFEKIYKETHYGHPCCEWARSNIYNYAWLVQHFKALHDEWVYRSHLEHKTYTDLYEYISKPAQFIFPSLDDVELRFNFDCSNVEMPGKIFKRYKVCLINKWNADKRPPKWFKRGMPEWATMWESNIGKDILVLAN